MSLFLPSMPRLQEAEIANNHFCMEMEIQKFKICFGPNIKGQEGSKVPQTPNWEESQKKVFRKLPKRHLELKTYHC